MVRAQSRYRYWSLVGLIEAIVEDADRDALDEFHSHRCHFRDGEHTALRCVELIDHLRNSWTNTYAGRQNEIIYDYAYDLTVDKFSNLPGNGSTGASQTTNEIDCRHYFAAFLRRVGSTQLSTELRESVELETRTAVTLQRFVVRHFHLSLMEARRRTIQAHTRYRWMLDTGALELRMPKWMTGRRRREWLQAHVPDVNPARRGEKERVQKIIDEQLGCPKDVPFTDQILNSGTPSAVEFSDDLHESESDVTRFVRRVEEAKINELPRLRPAIRKLGAHGVRKLVRRIFQDIRANQLVDCEVARAFNLSTATFSRFAGSRWDIDADRPIPDLWANTARVLSSDGTFCEIAQQSGVWHQVRETAKRARDDAMKERWT